MSNRGAVPVLDDIHLHIQKGEFEYEFTLRGLHPCDGTCSISGGALIVNGIDHSLGKEDWYSGEIPFVYLGAPGDESCKILRTSSTFPEELFSHWFAEQDDAETLARYTAEEIVSGKDQLRSLLSQVYQGSEAAKTQLVTCLMDFYVRRFASH